MFKKEINNFLLGFLIGNSIIFPGISAPMILINLNLYEEIIEKISCFTKDIKKNILYFIPIIFGVLIGIITGFGVIVKLFNLFPVFLLSLFISFMVKNVLISNYKIKLSFYSFFIVLLFCLIPLLISIYFITNNSINLDNPKFSFLFLLIIGFFLSLTQLIPGCSATSFLMNIGIYSTLINIIQNKIVNQYNILLTIILGFLIGFVLFVKFINNFNKSNLKIKNHIILGLSIGSIISMVLNIETIKIIQRYVINFNNNIIYKFEIFISIIMFFLFVIFNKEKQQ